MTSMTYKTEQEAFWAGAFGRDYIQRNDTEQLVASNIALFSRILSHMNPPASVIELGANIGLNLTAIRTLLPKAELAAVEINATACDELRRRIPGISVEQTSILELDMPKKFDAVLIKGVLIHINPDELPNVYDRMERLSAKYVIIAEYYNPSPVSIHYRGHSERLFKRDFAGEFLARHPGFEVVEYGFVWHRDPVFPQDDVTWFLLRRTGEPASVQ